MNNNIKQDLIEELSTQYDKEKVENEVEKYQKFFDIMESDKINIYKSTFKSIGLILLSIMYFLSFKYNIEFFGFNILSALPITVAVNIFVRRLIINMKQYLNNKIIYISMYILISVSALIALKLEDYFVFVGILASITDLKQIRKLFQ